MDAIIHPRPLHGTVRAIASKSMAHRLLICAALCPGPTSIGCPTTSKDIEATIACLESLGAGIEREGERLVVTPLPGSPSSDNVRLAHAGAVLDCGESGSTLRFLLPVLCALGQGGELTARVSAGSPVACEMDVSDFPDLVPPLAAVAALAPGTTTLTGCARLRLKESDRVESVCAGLNALGARLTPGSDTITIVGAGSLLGGVVDPANDHRIAMMAAIAATRCRGDVTIRGAQCVEKSYPSFFEDYRTLGGLVDLVN